MVVKNALGKTVAASFGAALATLYATPELNADVVAINFNPASKLFNGSLETITLSTTAGPIATFGQWNDSIGRTMVIGDMQSWAFLSFSNSISPATFAGATGNFGFGTSESGSTYLGFRSAAGNVGWFKVVFTAPGGSILFGPGQYGNNGESVHVGGSPVPEPGLAGLSLLGLGALGLRRRRAA
jgi:hypothetical protein